LGFSALAGDKPWPIEGGWLPEGTSTYSGEIDSLFYGILYLTGFVFIVTEGLLIYFVIKYKRDPNRRSHYTHGNHKLELVWTLTPAVILGVIAFVQKSTWEEIKSPPEPASEADVVRVHLFAKQFEWQFRYAGPDKKFGTADDFMLTNELVTPVNKRIIVEETSNDVIHSFFIPYQRLKQDAVPGMQIKCWFNSTKTTEEMRKDRPKAMVKKPGYMLDVTPVKEAMEDWDYPIMCAELCGMNHYQMRGKLTVLKQDEFDKWNEEKSKWFQANGDPDAYLFTQYWQLNKDGTRYFPPREEPAAHEEH